jgi:hypothetical protein
MIPEWSNVWRTARTIAATRQRTGTDLVRTFVNLTYVSAVLRHGATAARVQLVEQGAAQALWSVGLSAGDPAWTEVIKQHDVLGLTPDLVVLVEADLDTIRRRLADRDATVRLERMLKQDSTMLARSSSLLETVVRLLQERGIPIAAMPNQYQADLMAGTAAIASRIAALWYSLAAGSNPVSSEPV